MEEGAGQVDKERVEMLGQGEYAAVFSLDIMVVLV